MGVVQERLREREEGKKKKTHGDSFIMGEDAVFAYIPHSDMHAHTNTVPDREYCCTGSVMSVDPNINKEPPESHTDRHRQTNTLTHTHTHTSPGHLAGPALQITNSLIQETSNYD